MSPSKSKAKGKRAAGKEAPKSTIKPTTGGGGGPAGGYNPIMGTFHTLETTPVSTLPPINGRFRDIDDTDDPSGNAVGIGVDYDSISNNGSWSGESEDPKDKASSQGTTSRQEAVVSGDKREKIRQENEKKHQRQKERRAQELHDRCCGYLMSRKLESLAEKLVAMGFPLERATMALIMNQGRVEESVAWLFESGDDHREHNLDGGGNLKVDISQELAQISEMEIKFKCSKQQVERAVVACEGDLQQAAENLIKLQKQESPPKSIEPPAVVGGGKPVTPATTKVQPKRTLSSGAMPIQKPDDKDLNYPAMTAPAGRLVADSGTKNIQLLKKAPPASDWTKPIAVPSVEKRWPVSPSGSYSLAAPLPSKTEILGNEFKNLQLGSVVMSPSSSSHFSDWNSGEPPVNRMSMPTTTRSFSNPSSYGNQYDQFQYHPPPPQHYAPTPTLAAASFLGLFSGGGAQAAHVDWNGDWSSQFDYTNIDWSLNRIPSPSSLRPNGMWMGSGTKVAARPAAANGVGVGVVGGGSREWTSPFEEKDLFSLPRKFVSSPTL